MLVQQSIAKLYLAQWGFSSPNMLLSAAAPSFEQVREVDAMPEK